MAESKNLRLTDLVVLGRLARVLGAWERELRQPGRAQRPRAAGALARAARCARALEARGLVTSELRFRPPAR
jgi:hypothetical protein